MLTDKLESLATPNWPLSNDVNPAMPEEEFPERLGSQELSSELICEVKLLSVVRPRPAHVQLVAETGTEGMYVVELVGIDFVEWSVSFVELVVEDDADARRIRRDQIVRIVDAITTVVQIPEIDDVPTAQIVVRPSRVVISVDAGRVGAGIVVVIPGNRRRISVGGREMAEVFQRRLRRRCGEERPGNLIAGEGPCANW